MESRQSTVFPEGDLRIPAELIHLYREAGLAFNRSIELASRHFVQDVADDNPPASSNWTNYAVQVPDLARQYEEIDRFLRMGGIVEHSIPHLLRVSDIAMILLRYFSNYVQFDGLLNGLNIYQSRNIIPFEKYREEEKKPMAFLIMLDYAINFHDIGSHNGKHNHAEIGGLETYHILKKLGFSEDFCFIVAAAVALHSDSPIKLIDSTQENRLKQLYSLKEDSPIGRKGEDATYIIFALSTILFISDKLDISGSRVLPNQFDRNIHGVLEQSITNPHYTQALIKPFPDISFMKDVDGRLTLKVTYSVIPDIFLFYFCLDILSSSSPDSFYFRLSELIRPFLSNPGDQEFKSIMDFLKNKSDEFLNNNTSQEYSQMEIDTLKKAAQMYLVLFYKYTSTRREIYINPRRNNSEMDTETAKNEQNFLLQLVMELVSTLPCPTVKKIIDDLKKAYENKLNIARKLLAFLFQISDIRLVLETNIYSSDGIIFDSASEQSK
ncbi:MAG: hypothetical protein QHH09_03960 [Microgenomates group bacterium]|nr:hypothetical protein [Microgenomates group bacterium]